eukprot:CAMPEP_0119058742 /NCGR_PEP_ID=MMETSP1178-20130426/3013_1 /TAXON_ID=33656 /ORGANISM="unid sp, Strain CCMP2000" /LENGTH=35 /DNA_ID= /DNA_START= /DNA_END= /DNA_ORIENTATION=
MASTLFMREEAWRFRLSAQEAPEASTPAASAHGSA